MEAKDLRIGNIVLHKGVGHIVTGATIVYQKSTYKCEPMPLTEVGLLKLGFKLTSFPLDTYSTKPCYYKMGIKVRINVVRFFVKLESHRIDLKYVHELQNLYFALTGEELTIDK